MAQTGLLILTAPVQQLTRRISPILKYAASRIYKTLYVQLHPGLDSQVAGKSRPALIPATRDICAAITSIYAKSAQHGDTLDVRILLNNISNRAGVLPPPQVLSKEVGVVLTDSAAPPKVHTLLRACFVLPTLPEVQTIQDSVWSRVESLAPDGQDPLPASEDGAASPSPVQTYGHVVLGGTFDRMHTGHKILLSESAIRAEEKITVGVTDRTMLRGKILPELIEPLEERISMVCDYLRDVKPHLLHSDSVVGITDPYGPSIVDPAMRCIVVSEETKKGGEAVNKKRQEKGLCELDIHEIALVEDIGHAVYEEAKISSSSQRIRRLGTLLKQPQKRKLPGSPYVIGLTGGIASGKSSVCRRLEGLGAAVIDCDKLGHKAYLPATPGFTRVVEDFGQDVVGADGSINRRALGAKVFQDRSRLDRLNQIVWPEIGRMAREEIGLLGTSGCPVCVLDAAVLLEAGWQDFCHEVWSCIIHPDEALKRILERDGLPEEKAKQRIHSQLSNQECVEKSNLVLCTYWQPEVTQKQVEKAWTSLMERLPPKNEKSTDQPKL